MAPLEQMARLGPMEPLGLTAAGTDRPHWRPPWAPLQVGRRLGSHGAPWGQTGPHWCHMEPAGSPWGWWQAPVEQTRALERTAPPGSQMGSAWGRWRVWSHWTHWAARAPRAAPGARASRVETGPTGLQGAAGSAGQPGTRADSVPLGCRSRRAAPGARSIQGSRSGPTGVTRGPPGQAGSAGSDGRQAWAPTGSGPGASSSGRVTRRRRRLARIGSSAYFMVGTSRNNRAPYGMNFTVVRERELHQQSRRRRPFRGVPITIS
jgi:hypothetical protein